QLDCGAQHPFRSELHEGFCLDTLTAEAGASLRVRNPIADGQVRRAGHDFDLFAAGVDGCEEELVRLRVGAEGDHLSNHDTIEVGALSHDLLDFRARKGEALTDSAHVLGDVDVLLEPTERNDHQNCSRKRTSFSRRRRMSAMLYLSIAVRSSPMPKAKPE